MPLIPLVILLLLPVMLLVAIPFSLIQRYRVGSATRTARGWLATLNLVLIAFSTALFLWAAALTSLWIHGAFRYAILGVLTGGVLGLLGLALTRWEEMPRTFRYTPNRWLVLAITFAVAARLLYGFWRALHAWKSAGAGTSWLASAGATDSLAVGAIVLGYYLIYSAGIWRRLRQYRTRRARLA